MNASNLSSEPSFVTHDDGVATILRPRGAGTSPAAGMHWTETLRDGTHVLVRPIQKEDAELERAFIDSLSEQSRQQRFLGHVNAGDALIRKLTEIDYCHDMAFVALVHRDGEKQIVGVSRYSRSSDGRACECAVTVADDWQNRGLGTLLMRHLIETAREHGIRSMVSIDRATNHQMRNLAQIMGFTAHADPDDATQVIYQLVL